MAKSRRKWSEKDVIRTLIHQGTEIRCFRTKTPITLENVIFIQREHLHERELDGPDEPGNCRYSLKEGHDIVTNGTPATTVGSSKHRIAKAKRIAREGKFKVVRRRDMDQADEALANIDGAEAYKKAKWGKGKRKIRSRGFAKVKRRFQRVA